MTQEQATTILFNIVIAALMEALQQRGILEKESMARIVETSLGEIDDPVFRESAAMLAASIRTGGKPRLFLLDGGAPQPER